MAGVSDGAGAVPAGPQETEIISWPESSALPIYHVGYSRQAFIQEAAIALFTGISWDGKNPTIEANNAYQRAVVLANALGLK